MIDKFIKIEKEYSVDKIEYNNEKIWAYLRVHYIMETIKGYTSNYEKYNKVKKHNKYILLLKEFLYGFKNWFHGYNYLIFSNSSGRLKINNQYTDKNYSVIINKLGYNNCLYVDASKKLYNFSGLDSNIRVVSRTVLGTLIKIYRIFSKNNIKKINLLERIHKKEKINIAYQDIIYIFNKSYFIYKILLKIYKPKAIFTDCYSCNNQALIKAANDLGILTIELQHGLIGKNHIGYKFYAEVDQNFLPHTLLTFGEYDTNILKQNKYNPFKEIVPIGRHILESLKQQKIPKTLLDLKNSYKKIVSISTQYTIEDKLANFVIELSKFNENVLFIFSLRHYKKDYYKKFNLTKNIILYNNEFSCYDILKVSDIHITVFSSCAIEALFFKKPVVLIDIDKLATYYSMKEFSSKNITIISDYKEFSNYLNNTYIVESSNVYCENHNKLVDEFIKNILL